MKDKRRSNGRHLYHTHINENVFVFIDSYYSDNKLLSPDDPYEISEFLEVKPTLRKFTSLLDIKPTLMSLFQPITNRIVIKNNNKPVPDAQYTMEIKDGRLHCENAPALIYYTGTLEWWLNGNRYTFDEYWETQKNTIYAAEIMAYVLGSKDVNNYL